MGNILLSTHNRKIPSHLTPFFYGENTRNLFLAILKCTPHYLLHQLYLMLNLNQNRDNFFLLSWPHRHWMLGSPYSACLSICLSHVRHLRANTWCLFPYAHFLLNTASFPSNRVFSFYPGSIKWQDFLLFPRADYYCLTYIDILFMDSFVCNYQYLYSCLDIMNIIIG